jgi:hypothetical protein
MEVSNSRKLVLMTRNKQTKYGDKFCKSLKDEIGIQISVDEFLPPEVLIELSTRLGILRPSASVLSWKCELNWVDIQAEMQSHLHIVRHERVAIVFAQTPEFSFWSSFEKFVYWSKKLLDFDGSTIMTVSETTGRCFCVDVYESEIVFETRYSIGFAQFDKWC